jgi:hypothetical protein
VDFVSLLSFLHVPNKRNALFLSTFSLLYFSCTKQTIVLHSLYSFLYFSYLTSFRLKFQQSSSTVNLTPSNKSTSCEAWFSSHWKVLLLQRKSQCHCSPSKTPYLETSRNPLYFLKEIELSIIIVSK